MAALARLRVGLDAFDRRRPPAGRSARRRTGSACGHACAFADVHQTPGGHRAVTRPNPRPGRQSVLATRSARPPRPRAATPSTCPAGTGSTRRSNPLQSLDHELVRRFAVLVDVADRPSDALRDTRRAIAPLMSRLPSGVSYTSPPGRGDRRRSRCRSSSSTTCASTAGRRHGDHVVTLGRHADARRVEPSRSYGASPGSLGEVGARVVDVASSCSRWPRCRPPRRASRRCACA